MITLNLFSLMSPRKVSSCAKPSGLAQLAEPAAFFSAAGCRNDFDAQVFADLNGGDADAAAAGLDQQPVTQFYFAVFHQAEPCREKNRWHRCSSGCIDPFGHGADLGSFGGGIFGITTFARVGDNPPAELEFSGIGPAFSNRPGKLSAGCDRQLVGGNALVPLRSARSNRSSG
jgi:hypothetical protein